MPKRAKPKPKPLATRKQWLQDLMQKKPAVERAVGVPLGEMLGCGHFGCVFRSTAPWVVKLTVDPTEGPIWARIVQLIRDEEWGGQGFARVKEIVRLKPDVGAGARKRPLYAIVREDCEPVFKERRGQPATITAYTAKWLGLPEEHREVYTLALFSRGVWWGDGEISDSLVTDHDYARHEAERAEQRVKDFTLTISALQKYRELELQSRAVSGRDRFAHLDRPRYSRDELRERLEQVSYRMRGASGEYLGDSLRMLLTNDVVMRDVHLFNIGWRVHETIGEDWEPDCIVIYDPGHTPTPFKPEIEQRMVQNARGLG